MVFLLFCDVLLYQITSDKFEKALSQKVKHFLPDLSEGLTIVQVIIPCWDLKQSEQSTGFMLSAAPKIQPPLMQQQIATFPTSAFKKGTL